MTDKQIINSCEFQSRCIQYKDMYSNKHIKCPIVDFALACRGENKCKYKTVYEQLKAKEQECEELKEEISKLQLNEYHYKNELKKYKKGIHKYRNLLKYEINDLRLSRREFLKTVGRYPKFEKDNIKLALDTFNRKLELIDKPSRYRKALEEIEEIVKEPCVDAQEDCKHCDNWCEHKDILEIINKAKGEENAI